MFSSPPSEKTIKLINRAPLFYAKNEEIYSIIRSCDLSEIEYEQSAFMVDIVFNFILSIAIDNDCNTGGLYTRDVVMLAIQKISNVKGITSLLILEDWDSRGLVSVFEPFEVVLKGRVR